MSLSKIFTFTAIILISVLIGACTQDLSSSTEFFQADSSPTPVTSLPTLPPTATSAQQANPTSQQISETKFGFTYQQSNGNRIVPGAGDFASLTPIDIQLPGTPSWVVGVPFQEGIIWSVSLENGSIISLFSSEQGISDYPNPIPSLSPGAPIHSIVSDNQPALVTVPDSSQSKITHPIYLPKSNSRAYITQDGDLKFIDADDKLLATLSVNALPDARILVDDQDRILILTEPTEIYNHAVLGDGLEARTITLIDTDPTTRVISTISLEDNEVIEGIAPIWVDLIGDEDREIIVTVSDRELGAGIVVFSETGDRLAMGPMMGRPFRWRHQITVAPTGPDGENELIVVRTPHIGGVIEYYRIENGELKVAAEYAGITSHVIGSRNLDMAAVVDLDGDGAFEVLLPTPDLEELVAIRRTEPGAEEILKLPIGGQLSTNIAGVNFPNGQVAFAVGSAAGVLKIWTSE